jgi:hypothetical protein
VPATWRFTRDISVSIELDATCDDAWRALEPIEDHPQWMADAVAIRFVGDQMRGTGTEFLCDTKVGPFRLTDAMRITVWEPGTAMGVDHVGTVTGTGEFRLAPIDLDRRCRMNWSETLSFPWWMGGPIGASIGARVLRSIWRRNLASFRNLLATSG